MAKKLSDFLDFKIFSLTLIVVAIAGFFISLFIKLDFITSFLIVLAGVALNGIVIVLLGDKDQ